MNLPGLATSDNDYQAQRTAAIRKCQEIDAGEYQSGLWFNPEGYRSYYVRSQCYQQAAIRFRDTGLCRKVRRRWALFSSSWGYSESNCEKLVAEGVGKDRAAIGQMRQAYRRGHVRLVDFRIERNGNGRDFDILPEFAGAGAHAYELRFELLPSDPAASPVLLDQSGFYLEGETSNIRIYVPQADIRRRFPAFVPDQSWPVRATLVYSIGTGSYRGKWSESFIKTHFPEQDRAQTLTREFRF
ncbi:MAG: hypothetical protein PVJ15_03515 [Gammaproteobacteria bacterium]